VSAILIFLVSLQSFALGLGKIELHSSLNQPLDADIEILSLRDTALDEIAVKLASPEAYAKVGLERPFFLTQLKFTPDRKPGGKAYIHVSSEQAVKEPFVDFLVEINWPAGHLLREYTLLLDPPVFLGEEAPSVAAPVAGAQAAQPASAAPSSPLASRAPTAVAGGAQPASGPAGELSYGPVNRADTLWSIARKLRPDSATVDQVMVALLKANPEAFYHHNVNYLKAGYILRISDPEAISSVDREAAARLVREQNVQWQEARSGQAARATLRPLGVSGAASTAGTANQREAQPRLKLVAPGAANNGVALRGVADKTESGAPARATLESMRKQLALAQETSEVSRQENAELKDRLAALEKQINSMQRLMTLRGDTMAALQSNAAANQAASGQGTAPEEATGKAAAPGVASKPETTPAQQPAVPASAAGAVVPAPAPAPKEAPGLLSGLLTDPLLLGGATALILLILVLAWIILRRRQANGTEDFEDIEQPDEPRGEDAMAGQQTEAKATNHVPEEAVASVAETGIQVENLVDEDTGFDSTVDVFDAEEDEIDTLAEADVYLAYRRFDKAEELLKSALSQEPGRRDYVMKLLEVYAASENTEAFVQQAEALAADPEGTADESWDKVVSMGRVLAADHPLFVDSEAAGDADSTGKMDSVSDTQDTLPDIDLDPLATDNEVSGDEQTDIAREAFARLDDEDAQTAVPVTDQASEQETEDSGTEIDAPLDFDLNELRNNETAEELGIAETSADNEGLESIDTDTDADEISSTDDAVLADEDSSEETLTEHVAGEDEVLPAVPEAQGGLESVAEELRQTTQELSADISTGDNVLSFSLDEHPADTDAGVGSEEAEALGGELEADIDWLANISEDDNLDAELADLDSESELISGEDEISTKLDLARAYIDMGDQASARGILDEVLQEGSDDQKGEAEDLIRQIA